MSIPGRELYLELSRSFNLIPVYRVVNADLDTPISIYKKIRPRAPAYLLESVEGGESLARYSFIGFEPFLVFTSRGERCRISAGEGRETVSGSPLAVLEKVMAGFRVCRDPALPRFYGGAVGYISYDAVRFFERVEMPQKCAPDLPDCNFIFAGTVLIFDHVKRTLTILVNSLPGNDPEKSYTEAEERIEKTARVLKSGVPLDGEHPERLPAGVSFESNTARDDFIKKVLRAKEYIRAGDILQVVLSLRMRVPFQGEPFNVYRRLRALNPSPYLFYLDFGETVVAGSSPEMLVRVEEGSAETCPIAGTRPRGRNPAEDGALALELLEDEKERAEHLMLVDLGRNDLGKVCETGSVKVTRFMEVEKFSHVMHLVSNVRGRLDRSKTCFDALRACFPAGTVTGAPKVRAMEIISELEPERRGIYAGAIGYFGFSGNMDTAIAIRTLVIQGDGAYVQAGAGIVADSDPGREYEEIMNKARALLNALAEAG
ncbi:MAG TPA: anthranilate synthase component I [Bacillota bacterium]|nr:anthranilate synthase component I [Bacillota bacterium]